MTPPGGHIPYRDSKLTRILQPSLGGNAKTAIICNVTPAAQHVDESHSTLRFASRAKRVVNNAVVNEVRSLTQRSLLTLTIYWCCFTGYDLMVGGHNALVCPTLFVVACALWTVLGWHQH